jgi:hypothetical protein
VVTTLVDLAYFGITAGLYFLMRTRITTLTTYTPKPVQATLIAYIVTVCLLLLVALGAFVSHETDTSEQEWRRWRRKKEEDEQAKDQALHFQLWNTRAWVNRKFAYGMGQPRWQQILFTGGRAALFRHYGANNWKNPYETDEDLKKEVEQVAAFRAEWFEFNDDDKAVVDEAVVEQQISDIELTRDREKLEKKRILGDISDKEYWDTRRKLEKKRAKVKASKVQRANIAKKMENIADTDAVSEDTKKEFVMLQRFQLLALSRAGRRLDPRQMDFLKRTRHLAEPQKPVAPTDPELAVPAEQGEGIAANTSNVPTQEPLSGPHNPYQQMRDAFGRVLPVQQPRAPVQVPPLGGLQAGTDGSQLVNDAVPSLTNPPAGSSAPTRSDAASTAPLQIPTPIPGSSSAQAPAPMSSSSSPVKDMAVAAATAFAARKFANNKEGARPNLAKAAMSASAGIRKHRKSAAFKKPNARFLAGVAGDVLAANAVNSRGPSNKRFTRLRMTVMMAAHHEKSGIKIAKDFVKAQGAVDMAALADLTQKVREPVPVTPQAGPLRQASPMPILLQTPESPSLRLPMPAPVHTRRMSPPQDRAYIKPFKKVVETKLVPRLRSPQREDVHRQRSPSPVTSRAPSPTRPPVMWSERPASPQQIKPAARFANAVQTLLPVNMPAASQRLPSPQPAPIVEAAPRPAAMPTGQQVQPEQRKIAALPNMPFPGVLELMKSIPLLEVKKATKTVPPRSDTEEILVLSAAKLPQEKDEHLNGIEPKPKLPDIPETATETEKKEPARDTMLLAWK